MPKSIDEALALDKINGNKLWEEAIKKDMVNVSVAFRPHEDIHQSKFEMERHIS